MEFARMRHLWTVYARKYKYPIIKIICKNIASIMTLQICIKVLCRYEY